MVQKYKIGIVPLSNLLWILSFLKLISLFIFLSQEKLSCNWREVLMQEKTNSYNFPLNFSLKLFICTNLTHINFTNTHILIISAFHCYCLIFNFDIKIRGTGWVRTIWICLNTRSEHDQLLLCDWSGEAWCNHDNHTSRLGKPQKKFSN